MNDQNKVIIILIGLILILGLILGLKVMGIIKPVQKDTEIVNNIESKNEIISNDDNISQNIENQKKETLKEKLIRFIVTKHTTIDIVLYICLIVINIGIGRTI